MSAAAEDSEDAAAWMLPRTLRSHQGSLPNGQFIRARIDGQAEGDRFLRRLDCWADPDALYHAIVNAFDASDVAQPRLRGFARALQKVLEMERAA